MYQIDHADNVIGNATICLGGRCEYGLKRYLQQCKWYLTNDYPINVKNSLFLNANGTGIVTWYYKCYYNIFFVLLIHCFGVLIYEF